jgi:hypothetical protein
MTYAALSILNERRMLRFEKFVPMALVGLLSVLPVIGYYLWARHLALLYPPHHFAGEGNWVWDYGLPQWAAQRYFVSRLWEILIRIWTLPGVVLLALGLLFPLFKKSGVEQERRKAPPSSSTSAPWIFHWWITAGVVYYLIGALELLENPSNFHLLSPAVAALSGNAILILASFAAKQARQHDLRMAAVAILFVVAVGVCGRQTSRVYSAYARQSYGLGLALREVSQPNDLVVTLGNAIGCPVAIYYSGRRGWLFPPFEEIHDWDRLPGDDKLIEIFEDLRAKGANWFGVVNERRDDIWKDHPKFAHYLERVCELRQMNQHAVIYHIRSA